MEVDSVSGDPRSDSTQSILATIDWERIESQQTLDALIEGICLEPVLLPQARQPGTVIKLSRLRRPWTDRERVRFIAECRSFQVPDILSNPLPSRLIGHPLLFDTPVLRDATSHERGFEIALEGDFGEGDSYWERLAAASNWVLEIDCKTDKHVVRYAVAPAKATVRQHPRAAPRKFEHPHPNFEEGPFFQARILVRDQKIQDKDILDLSRQTSGVRVYMEGFRVLPYGDSGDDWLSLDSNYTRRSWQTDAVFDDLVKNEEDAGDWQLHVLSNRSYTGAVFLTQEDAPTLRMLVNREGFAVEQALDTLVELVKRGIDLLTRTRAAATADYRQRQREERDRARQPAALHSSGTLPITSAPQRTLAETTATAMETVRETRRLLAENAASSVISQRLEITQSAIAQVVTLADKIGDSTAMLQVLASLGTQMAGFVHEIRGLLGTAVAIHEAVDRIRTDQRISGESRKSLNAIYQSLGDLRRQIERQAAYLIDLTSTDARRRRSSTTTCRTLRCDGPADRRVCRSAGDSSDQ